MTPTPSPYDTWTREDLIARLLHYERVKPTKPSTTHVHRPFDISRYPRRKIAIKFCYSGWEYNGLAFQQGYTPLPTVEQVLFDAFARTKLVDPKGGHEGCGWERCGRTDRGVSAAGQVVSLWVRTTAGDEVVPELTTKTDSEAHVDEPTLRTGESDQEPSSVEETTPKPMPMPELRYVSILNRVLPLTIRVLAWSPVSPTFSARFACLHRHYKYFFSPHGLDISLMRDATARLIGEHDFRNLCKLDAAKQITSFKRTILRAEINSMSRTGDEHDDNNIFVFDLVGTAFLYHQVRHIMAVLFLVGTGLEHPSVISALLNVSPIETPYLRQAGDDPLEVVDRKPEYQMADSLPLMLWDCAYADTDVRWRTDGCSDSKNGEPLAEQAGTGSDLSSQLHAIHTRSLVRAALESHFLSAAIEYHPPPLPFFPLSQTGFAAHGRQGILQVPLGGGKFSRSSNYVPLLLRKRNDSVEVANERWRMGKGERRHVRKLAAAALAEGGDDDD